jgi:cell division FtsZ-interacting protein ZapD
MSDNDNRTAEQYKQSAEKYRQATMGILRLLRELGLSYGEASAVLENGLYQLEKRSKKELDQLPMPEDIEYIPTEEERFAAACAE